MTQWSKTVNDILMTRILSSWFFSRLGRFLYFVGACFLLGCGPSAVDPDSQQPTRIVLQTNWHAQPEHGGFYQALVKGFYAEEGLDVVILTGGPNANTLQRVVLGQAHFSHGRTDDIIIAASKGLPLVMTGALMQKDPQAIMFHQSSGIENFKDLDGRPIMATPGLAYIEILKRTHGIDFPVIPSDFGLERFIADKQFVQQVFATNEPYYVRQRGADPGLLMLSDSGFDPFRVWYTSRAFLRENPEAVAAFTRASIRGWQDYLSGDRSEANAMIAARNPIMTEAFMQYSVETMIALNLVTGDEGGLDRIGFIDRQRLQQQIQQLQEIGLLESTPDLDRLVEDRLMEGAGSEH